VLLLDVALPGRDGLDVLRQARDEHPKLPVLMLSTYPDRQYAVRSLKLGARGYLNKSADSETDQRCGAAGGARRTLHHCHRGRPAGGRARPRRRG